MGLHASCGLKLSKMEEITCASCPILACVECRWFLKKKKMSNVLCIYEIYRAVHRFEPPSPFTALQCQQNSLETHSLTVLRIRNSQTSMEFQHSLRCLCPDPLDVTVWVSSELD